MRLTFTLVAALTLVASLLFSTEPSRAPLTADQGKQGLLGETTFAFGGVGFAGATSGGELAFRAVVAGPDAVQQFQEILAKATPEGKLYALAGIRKLAPGSFEKAAAVYAADSRQVTEMSGCEVMKTPMSGIVAELKSGRYDVFLKADAKVK